MNERLYRSRDERVIAGVCGGLAERFATDPSLVRLAFAILWLFTGIVPLTALYVLAVIIVPEAPGGWAGYPPAGGVPPAPSAPGEASGADQSLAGTAAAAGAPPATDWYASRRAEREARRAARREERARRGSDPLPAIVIGVFLVGLGAWLLVRDLVHLPWEVVWPAAIISVGALLLVLAFRPRSGGGPGQP